MNEIDYSKLKTELEAIAKTFASIGKSLSEASSQSTNPAGKLQAALKQAKDAAESWDKKLGDAKTDFYALGKDLGLAGERLDEFAEKQKKAFENQTTQAFANNLRENLKLLGLNNDEARKLAESLGSIADKFTPISGLELFLEKPLTSLAKGADKKEAEFYDKTLPTELGKVSDAFTDIFSSIVIGSKKSKEAFDDFGKSIKSMAEQIAAELITQFMRVQMQAMLFGSEKGGGGGLLGGLVGWAGNAISSLFATPVSSASNQGTTFGAISNLMARSANGNVFTSPALSAYSNSIVSSPTIFPFAKGGAFRLGLMGEAGPEAIMPLRRGPGGRLGVDAAGFGGQQSPQVNVNIINQMGESADVSVRQAPSTNGGVNFEVMIKQQIRNAMADGSMDRVMGNRFGLRPALMGR
ncbi:MAG: hypothetical protein FWG04_05170 [Desulfovibrionaceae bacterium]|nr:hypothetical protein [Desulfovibrionaceae bacterium]